MPQFLQNPPELRNQYDDDRALRSFLTRVLPDDLLHRAEGEWHGMGQWAVDMARQQLAERQREPVLQQWDVWGNRVDHIELTEIWQRARIVAAKSGLVATAYEGEFQPYGRVLQFALVYLFHASSDMYTCPLAMSDGAARCLLDSGNTELIGRAVSHLTSRDPHNVWTSGQWMTETAGGSDLSGTGTIASHDGQRWKLDGLKWFTSAANSEMALALARMPGEDGSRGPLGLFYVEPQRHQAHCRILRLKDKLGT